MWRTLRKDWKYAIFWSVNRFVGSEAPKQNVFDQFWKFKFHFEHISRSTQFLSFDWPTNYLYLFKNHRQTFPRPGKRPSSHLKVTKSDFFQTLNTFRNPSLRIFPAGKASLVIIQNYSTYCYIISAFWRILIGNGSKQDIKFLWKKLLYKFWYYYAVTLSYIGMHAKEIKKFKYFLIFI